MNQQIEEFVLGLMDLPNIGLVEVEGHDFPVTINATFANRSGAWSYTLDGPEDYSKARAYFEGVNRAIQAQQN